MKPLRRKVFFAAGYNTMFFGPGRKEFNPKKPMRPFNEYLQEAAEGTCSQVEAADFDEGVIGNFMAPRFIKQANLPGFLPSLVPSLLHKPCTGVEGACGSGGRALATAIRIILSDCADAVFVTGFEVQNTMKAVYGADVLSGAGFHKDQRKTGCAHFFPGVFAERAGAYYDKYGYEDTRQGMAHWYEHSVTNARLNPKAQEYHNTASDLYGLGMTEPNAERFVPNLNLFDCSKVSDGASAIVVASEEGLKRLGVALKDTVQVVGVGGAEGDITAPPIDPTALTTTHHAVKNALAQAGISHDDLGLLELHDCFSITALLALEAVGFAGSGKASAFIRDGGVRNEGAIPTNLSGGLCGFGHPVGASGVRQAVDLWQQLTGHAENQIQPKNPLGMLVSMGGNDVTVTAIVVKAAE